METEMKQKKEYSTPEMKEINLEFGAYLLQNSEQSDPPGWGGEFD